MNELASVTAIVGVGELVTSKDAEFWAEKIRLTYQKSVEAQIEVGRLLLEAKARLMHGDWGRLTGETQPGGQGLLPFSPSSAQRYIKIAGDKRISNPAHVQDLPSSWGTLYELTKLDDETFERGLREKKINPEMERKDVAALTSYTHVSDDSYEWYTPGEYIESARTLMGSIDLDPATCDEANKVVQAESIFTAKDNGLSQDWHGNVWLNPPYCMPEVQQFTQKCISAFLTKEIDQAVVLVNNATDTGWFGNLLDVGYVCFTDGRVHFYTAEGEQKLQTRQGQAFFYLGRKEKLFLREFSKHGYVGKLARG